MILAGKLTNKTDRFSWVLKAILQKKTENTKKYGLTKENLYAIIYRHLRVQPKYRGVEQLVARRAHNPEVVGSSPASATTKSTENNLFSVLFLYF